MVKAGEVRHLGASSVYAWQVAKALRLARLNAKTPFVSAGIAVLPWSPLARGRLAYTYAADTIRTR